MVISVGFRRGVACGSMVVGVVVVIVVVVVEVVVEVVVVYRQLQ